MPEAGGRRQAAGGQRWTRPAPEGLAIAATQPVDLVITDIRMPGMDGCAVIQRLKQSRPSLPIVVLSGILPFREMERAGAAAPFGAEIALGKPFHTEMLIAAVEKLTPPSADE